MRRSAVGMNALLLLCGFAMAQGCGDGETDGGDGAGGGSPEQTGSTCDSPADCYPNVAATELKGAVQCLDEVRGGYCTHECTSDTDCCAADGECDTTLAQVCSPFESTGLTMCFLSCEAADIQATGLDEQAFCQNKASSDFACRSSGGGSDNRKVCVPAACGIGSRCVGDADCDSGLTCDGTFAGGYCTKACTLNADCPANSFCTNQPNGEKLCMRGCAGASDCSLCRQVDDIADCRNDVTFAETGTTASVCVPR